MHKLRKIIGWILILITIIWSWYIIWQGVYKSNFNLFSLSVIVLILIALLPIGVTYVRTNKQLLKPGKIAIWLHLSSIILFILGLLPLIPCLLNRLSCEKGGVGETILFAVSTVVSGLIYVVGLLFLSQNKDMIDL